MANTTSLLLSQPPKQPDTIVVMGAFRGAADPIAPALYAGTAPVAGEYMELGLAGATAPEVIVLADGAAGDRVAFLATNLGLGVTVSGTGLSYSFTDADHIVVFEFDGTSWEQA